MKTNSNALVSYTMWDLEGGISDLQRPVYYLFFCY